MQYGIRCEPGMALLFFFFSFPIVFPFTLHFASVSLVLSEHERFAMCYFCLLQLQRILLLQRVQLHEIAILFEGVQQSPRLLPVDPHHPLCFRHKRQLLQETGNVNHHALAAVPLLLTESPVGWAGALEVALVLFDASLLTKALHQSNSNSSR